ncbi:metallophosphoesterase family protein, partial [Candidatus Dependentiae bacterium]
MLKNQKKYIQAFLIAIFFISNITAMKRFVAMGDPHAGRSKFKTHYLDFILKMKKQYPKIDKVFIPGDLTDSNKIGCSLYCNSKWGKEISGIFDYGQWGKLCSSWVNPLKRAGMKVFMTLGNHDLYNHMEGKKDKLQPIFIGDMLKAHYYKYDHKFTKSDIAYAFKEDNCYFICCGVYPDKEIQAWLKIYLANIVKANPVFFFFHYPVCGKKGSKDFRDGFYNTIKDYNVKAIFTGHVNSFTHLWHDKIPVFSCGGTYFAVPKYNSITGNIDLKKSFFVGDDSNTSKTYKIKGYFDEELYNIEEIF